jgi:hypothetical protein
MASPPPPIGPTGRVLVRFAAGDRIEAHREELRAAGYELDAPLGFAPQAGYVRPATREAGLDRLRAISGVEHVEPEVLIERSAR